MGDRAVSPGQTNAADNTKVITMMAFIYAVYECILLECMQENKLFCTCLRESKLCMSSQPLID
jgi:hypothetical protein